jgi:hypothetical protein
VLNLRDMLKEHNPGVKRDLPVFGNAGKLKVRFFMRDVLYLYNWYPFKYTHRFSNTVRDT